MEDSASIGAMLINAKDAKQMAKVVEQMESVVFAEGGDATVFENIVDVATVVSAAEEAGVEVSASIGAMLNNAKDAKQMAKVVEQMESVVFEEGGDASVFENIVDVAAVVNAAEEAGVEDSASIGAMLKNAKEAKPNGTKSVKSN